MFSWFFVNYVISLFYLSWDFSLFLIGLTSVALILLLQLLLACLSTSYSEGLEVARTMVDHDAKTLYNMGKRDWEPIGHSKSFSTEEVRHTLLL